MKNKNKKISRKEFVLKTSKVAGGMILCPAIISSLSSCSDPVSPPPSNELDFCSTNSDGLIAQCGWHGAQFNTDGCPVSGPTKNNLTQYSHSPLIDNNLTIIISETESENVNISEEGNGALLIVGQSLLYSSQNIGNLLIYRKSEDQFNIFSAICPHEQGPINLFV